MLEKDLKINNPSVVGIKMASYLHRTAQPSTLATFRSWGSSTGAGRIRLAGANIRAMFLLSEKLQQ